MLDAYTVVADPSRRRILDRLLQSDASVTELVDDLGVSQPLVSKHLRILRDSGFVRFRVDAQRRIYSLDPGPLKEIDAWLSAYRTMWMHHVDRLSDYLDRKSKDKGREL